MNESLKSRVLIAEKLALEKIKHASSLEILTIIKNEFLSKDGIFTHLTNDLKNAPLEEKKTMGSSLNDAKERVKHAISEQECVIIIKTKNFPDDATFDPGLQKINIPIQLSQQGSIHPYSHAEELVYEFFGANGFTLVTGPTLETDYFNFTALNIPSTHPAREGADTFWINDTQLLRTHTSSVQIRRGQEKKPPFGLSSFGRVYRNEATDATHDFMFYQLEGMYVNHDASLANLLDTLKKFFNYFFGSQSLDIRVRPGFFPFVEPGVEIDFECPFCTEGCKVCKGSRWIELGGAGEVHPEVMKHLKLENNAVRGWAFGIGITRLIMLKYQICDIRLLHNNIP